MHKNATPLQLHRLLPTPLLLAPRQDLNLYPRHTAPLQARFKMRLILPPLHARLDRLAHAVIIDLDEQPVWSGRQGDGHVRRDEQVRVRGREGDGEGLLRECWGGGNFEGEGLGEVERGVALEG